LNETNLECSIPAALETFEKRLRGLFHPPRRGNVAKCTPATLPCVPNDGPTSSCQRKRNSISTLGEVIGPGKMTTDIPEDAGFWLVRWLR